MTRTELIAEVERLTKLATRKQATINRLRDEAAAFAQRERRLMDRIEALSRREDKAPFFDSMNRRWRWWGKA